MTTIMPSRLCADCGTVDGHREDCPTHVFVCAFCRKTFQNDESHACLVRRPVSGDSAEMRDDLLAEQAENDALAAALTTLRREATAALLWCPACEGRGHTYLNHPTPCPRCAPLRAAIEAVEGS